MVKAISKATGCSDKQIRDQTVKLGDLGKVASINKSSQSTMDKFFTKKAKKEPLTLKRVFETFKKMAVTKGNNSTAEKENMIMKLIMDSVGEEATYIIRFIQQNLKIGAAEASMQSALCRAFLISHYRDEVAMDPDNKKPFPAIPDFDQKVNLIDLYAKKLKYLNSTAREIRKLRQESHLRVPSLRKSYLLHDARWKRYRSNPRALQNDTRCPCEANACSAMQGNRYDLQKIRRQQIYLRIQIRRSPRSSPLYGWRRPAFQQKP